MSDFVGVGIIVLVALFGLIGLAQLKSLKNGRRKVRDYWAPDLLASKSCLIQRQKKQLRCKKICGKGATTVNRVPAMARKQETTTV